MDKNNNSPTYTTIDLIPKELDFPLNLLSNMDESKFKEHIESVRIHLLNVIKTKHPPFGCQMSEEKIIQNLKKLNSDNTVKFISPHQDDFEEQFEDGLLKYNPHYTKGVNHWFFDIWHTKQAKGINPLTQFFDSTKFHKNIHSIIKGNKFKIFERKPNCKLSNCLSLLRLCNGAKPAFNFPSDLAKWIYLNAALRLNNMKSDFYVLDSCAGWGGRLGGILAACNHYPLEDKNVYYYCTDVNQSTHEQFFKLTNYWKKNINPKIKFKIHKSLTPAEDLLNDNNFIAHAGKFDIAFTSPPYFRTEQYSDDKDQSYLKYPKYDEEGELSWKNGFLKRMIETTFKLLKPNGEFWINIADINDDKNLIKYPVITLESDTLKLAKEAGFRHILTYKIITPNIYAIIDNKTQKTRNNKRKEKRNIIMVNGKETKYEPIFVFQKPEANNKDL